jgi:hypothetical protein
MGHDPETSAARYLAGEMSAVRRSRLGEHLLTCDECWQEVAQAQEGRRLVESVRTVAPPQLRERVRGLVQAAEPPVPAPARRGAAAWRTATLTAAAALVAALALAGIGVVDRDADDPPAVRAAVEDFNARALPGRELPTAGAPDLSALRLRPVGAGGGEYDGLEVDGYAYRDDVGRRIVLYRSPEPFPTADGAQALSGPDGPWIVRRGDVVVLCARSPHALLVVGEDDELVRRTAAELEVV